MRQTRWAKCWAKSGFQQLRETRGGDLDGLLLPEEIAGYLLPLGAPASFRMVL